MIENNDIKNLLITSDTIPSQSLVVAEWNMNRYQPIANYGLYLGAYNDTVRVKTNYFEADTDIKSGKLYLIYDDNSYQVSPVDQYYSSLASVFEPDRPDPGIVLLTHIPNGFISASSKNTGIANISTVINTASPRFYPFSKSRPYDYFNSARYIDPDDKSKVGISAAGAGGGIENTNIFVVYDNTFPCNKIVIKLQDYSSVPDIYAIDILKSNNQWEQVFFANDSDDIVNGVLEIYYKKVNGSDVWDTTVARLNDLNELTTPSTELKTIKGIRLRVGSMTVKSTGTGNNKKYYRSGLELIEMSPRIEADLTDYSESFQIQSSMGDGEIGLPIGTLVTGNGSILLSNEGGYFLTTSKAAEYKMLTPEVEFRFYQVMEVNNETYNVPLKVMYSDSWSTSDDFTANVSLVDRMKLLSEKKAVDLCFVSKDGIPLSVLILFLLDNSGITGYQFKKSDFAEGRDDTLIKTFFCKKEETITEVLQKLAVGTQSSMFIDAFNNLNVFTKEKINSMVSDSTADYWMIMDENYGGYSGSTNFQNYLANVVSTNDEKIPPVTDGKIEYRAFGINKGPGYSLLQDVQLKDYLEDTPFLSLVGTGYGPKFTRLWSADQSKNSVFGAGTFTGKSSSVRASSLLVDTYTASTQEAAVTKIFNASCIGNTGNNVAVRESMLIPIDNNDIYYFDSFSGYVMIDREIISYNGKVFNINGRDKILFSKDQFIQEVANFTTLNSSIIPKALVVDLIFNPVSNIDRNDDLLEYTIKSDGRGQFGTKISEHNSDQALYVTSDNVTSFTLGKEFAKAPDEKFFKENIQSYYDYSKISNWTKLKSLLGFSNQVSPRTYNGLLKLTGPPIPDIDRKAISGSATIENQNKINDKVSENIGDFGPFVYTYGERNVYIQKITDIVANPSIIAARMKLLSSKESQTYSGPKVAAHSSIAGIGFALKEDENNKITNGYFFEIESFGSAGSKEETNRDKNARASNIRFYRVTKNDAGKLIPDVLAVARASIIPSLDTTLQFNPDEPTPADQIVDLEVRVSLNNNGNHKFSLYYGNRKIKFIDDDNSNKYIDNDGNIIDADNTILNIWSGAQNVFMFVRNDSAVVFDYIMTGKVPSTNIDAFINDKTTEVISEYQRYINGSLPSKSWINDDLTNVIYHDFANCVREVKKYTIRYDYPSLQYKLIDISRINPKYRIYRENYTSMGAELVVVNTSNEPISLSENSALPLFIIGTQVEEITKGEVDMKGFYDKTDEFGKKQILFALNKSIYGEKTFNLASDFIQSIDQANSLMRWIIKCCSRERFKMSMEIMFNPLLELGDKVKIFSSSRGYYNKYLNQANTGFGNKTFVVSEINHSISTSGVSTNVVLIEVGE